MVNSEFFTFSPPPGGTELLLDIIIRNSVCTPAKLPCRRVEVGYEKLLKIGLM
jgi:hypothetical protein